MKNDRQKIEFLRYYSKIIDMVVSERNSGKTLAQIASDLNSAGHVTREGNQFSQIHISRILDKVVQPGALNSTQSVKTDSQLQQEVEQLKSEIYTLKTQVEELQQELSELKSQVEELQNKSLLQKNSYVEIPVDSQIDPAEPVDAFSEEKPIEPAPTPLSRKPARPASERKKVVLQQAIQLHVENSKWTKTAVATELSKQYNIRFRDVLGWLKKLW